MHRGSSGTDSSRHLIVISMDGLSRDDATAIAGLPNFAALLSRASFTRLLRSVYPSLTYVAHTTMMTGRHPDAHGVTHNLPLQPGLSPDRQRWFWYAKEVGTPTLFDLVRNAGLSAAAVLWPLVGGARIRWNLPEIAALPGENQTLKVLRAGSPAYLLAMQLRFGAYRHGARQPQLDDFTSRCAAWTFGAHRPNLLMTHLIGLDDAKHHHGSTSREAGRALEFLDVALGRIVAAIGDAGLADRTSLIVLGDHGHIDITRRVRLNVLLRQAGLCGAEGGPGARGGAFRWRAWCRCSGGSAFLQVRGGDGEAASLARAALERAAGVCGIEALLGRAEMDALHCDREATLAIEAKRGTQFIEDLDGDLVDDGPAGLPLGSDHGYSPDKPGYSSLFLAAGPGIRRGLEFGRADMVDVGPTCAHLLDLQFPDADGRVLTEIVEEA